MKTNRNLSHNHLALLARLGRHLRRLRPYKNLGRRSAGQGLVEFALILPFLLLLLLGIIEFSYVFAAYTSLFNAAREGVRHGAVQPKDQVGIIFSARNKIFMVNPAAADITIAYDDGPGTTVFTDTEQLDIGQSRVLINVVYDLPTITPVIHPLWPELHVEMQAARTVASLGDIEAAMPPGGFFGGGGGGGGEGGGGGGPAIFLSIDAPQMVHSGDAVQFTYTVENTGDVDLTNVTIVDGFGNVINAGNLAAGATTVETVTEILVTTITNQAVTVTGFDNGEPVSHSANVTVIVIHPAIDLIVDVNPPSVSLGGTTTFIYTVQNTGDADLSGVTINDSLGSSIGPANLTVGETIFWEVPYAPSETMVNNVTSTGIDPIGGTVLDSDSAQVEVTEDVPIIIQEPLNEGDTVVVGTAKVGESVFVYDPQDPSISGSYNVTNGTFSFTVPPLVIGHTIVVAGYGKWDSAIVQGELDNVTISTLCHGSTTVVGTGEPNRIVNLLIADTGYQDSTMVDSSGAYIFTLYGGLILQYEQFVSVSGYGKSASTSVAWCGGADPYLVISPQCGFDGTTFINIKGYNWTFQNQNDDVIITWDGNIEGTYNTPQNPPDPWETDITLVVTGGTTHTLTATNERLPVSASTNFMSPCPAANLIVTDLQLLTTGVLSTHQPLEFGVTVRNTGARPVNSLFWTDLYAAAPSAPSSGLAWGGVSSLSPGQDASVIIRMPEGLAITGTHQIWALADSWDQVDEANEDDNVRGPIGITITLEGTESTGPITGTGTIEGLTQVSLGGGTVPHGRAHVWCVDANTGAEVQSTTSDEDGWYELADLPEGTYLVMAETWIDGTRYFGIVPGPIDLIQGEAEVAVVTMY